MHMLVVSLCFCWWLMFLWGIVVAAMLGVYPEPCTWEGKPPYWITSQPKLEAVGPVWKPRLHWRVPLLFLQDGEYTLWRKASSPPLTYLPSTQAPHGARASGEPSLLPLAHSLTLQALNSLASGSPWKSRQSISQKWHQSQMRSCTKRTLETCEGL